MGLTKASIKLVKTKGLSPPSPSAPGVEIPFQYNPKEVKVSRQAFWEHPIPIAGANSPPEYKGPAPRQMSLEMFLDASDEENGDVSVLVDKLLEACAPTLDSEARKQPLPASAIFSWDKVYFRGFIEKVSATYTLFRETGKPVRATCTVELTETPPAKPRQNPSSGGRGAQSLVQLVSGDTLAAIAFREYGDATLWRAIAAANSIDDPIRVRPGTQLLIPAALDAVEDR